MTEHRDDPRVHRPHVYNTHHEHAGHHEHPGHHEHEHGGRHHHHHEPALPDSRSPSGAVAALLGPFIAPLAGTLAAWLSTEFPGLELNASDTTEAIIQGATFLVGTLGAGTVHYKYLHGKQQWEKGVIDYHTKKLHAHRHQHHHHRPEHDDDATADWAGPAAADAGWSAPDGTDTSAWAGDGGGEDDDYSWPDDTTAGEDDTWVAYADVEDS